MVIWKKNYKYVKKHSNAKVVDTLRLQNLHPERLEIAIENAKEFHWEFDKITLIKEWNDWFVYGVELENEIQNAVLVNSKHDVRLGKMYKSNNQYFSIFEIESWRAEVLAEFLRIQKESPNITNEQIASELSILSDERCAHFMSEGIPDLIENAREYVYYVTL